MQIEEKIKKIIELSNSRNIIAFLGFLTMILSGEIFYKVMMALTCGSIFISGSMAVVVEGGKFFFTRMIANAKPTRDILIVYRSLKCIMVSFSLLASLFFFNQFLSDKTNLEKVVEAERQQINTEYNRKIDVLKEKLQDMRLQGVAATERAREADPKAPGYQLLIQDRRLAQQAMQKEQSSLTKELLLLEQERSKRLNEANNPSRFTGDERARNPQLHAMVATLRSTGIPIEYNLLLFSFCVMISVSLEMVIHIAAALPVAKVAPQRRSPQRKNSPIRRAA